MKTFRQGTTFYIDLLGDKELVLITRITMQDELYLVCVRDGNRFLDAPMKTSKPTKQDIINHLVGSSGKFIKFRKVRYSY